MASYQCLLFLMPKVPMKNSKEIVSYLDQNRVKAFVLLPSSVFQNSKMLQFFASKNIELINNQQCQSHSDYLNYSLQYAQVEVMELVIKGLNSKNLQEFESPFRVSVETGNDDIVRQLFGRDAAVCVSDDFTVNTCNAVDSGNLEILEWMLACRADISYRNIFAGTLLHLAILRKDIMLVKLLLKQKANTNARMNDLATPLHLAVEIEDNVTIVDLLLENGANIHAARKGGFTSLLLAVDQKQLETVRLLLKKGADPNMGTYDGLMPLHFAARNGSLEIMNDLIKQGANINAMMTYCRTSGITPLCFAVEEGELEIVKLLLKCGANVDSLSYDGQTVLGLAVDDGNLEIIEALLERRPNVNNKMNQRVLHEAVCRDGKIPDKIVKMLLEDGFIIDVQHANDSKLLHQAICKNYSEIVTQLLDFGVDVNKLYRYFDNESSRFKKTTPLVTAVRFSEENMVKLLVKRGADINANLFLDDIMTPVDEAVDNCNLKALKVLIANNASYHHNNGSEESEEVFYFAIKSKCSDLVEDLLNKGVNVSGNVLQPTTPIIHAARKSSLEIVRLLLKFGANVDSRDADGCTALHAATDSNINRLDIVKLLVQNGADLDAKSFSKATTPISNAVSKGHIDIVKELVKLGAKIDFIDNCGASPLHYAVGGGHMAIFSALLANNFTDLKLIQKTNICKLFSIPYIKSLRNRRNHQFNWLKFRTNQLLLEDGDFKKAADVLARHVILTKAAFCDCNINFIEFDNTLRVVLANKNLLPSWYRNETTRNNFFWDCETEVARLKTRYVGASSVTFYDILTKDVKQLVCYARNTDIVETINSKDYVTMFPIYARVILYQFYKGIYRRNLLNRAVKSFHLLSRQFKELPRNLKEDLLDYLSNKDLEVLIYACTETDA